MRRRLFALFSASVGAVLLPTLAEAADRDVCLRSSFDDERQWQHIYSACTRLIGSGRASAAERSQYYLRRGEASERLYIFKNVQTKVSDGDYDRAIAADATNAEAYLMRAYASPDATHKLQDFTTYIRLRPRDGKGYAGRAEVLVDKGDLNAAEADALEAGRLRANEATSALQRLASAWQERDEHDRAIAVYDAAIRLEPSGGRLYYYAHQAAWGKGDIDLAIRYLTEGMRVEPSRAYSHLVERAKLYEKTGNYELATADYSELMRLKPENAGDYRVALYRLETKIAERANTPGVQTASKPQEPTKHIVVATSDDAATKQSANAVEPQRESRMALVIGNSAYANAARLPNPKNDAELIGATLRRTGFSRVDVHHDLGRERLLDTLKVFAAEADKADWAIVYFAGHGTEIGGVNYLVPVDAKLKSDRDIPYEAVSVEQVLHAVSGTRKLKLVVLDACRDNPFLNTMTRSVATRAAGRGLAQMEPDSATLVAFAAKHGQVAQDGEDANSPFAAALARAIETPGLEISLLLRKVRDEVLSATGRRQEPFTYGSLPSEAFYFRTP